MEELEYALEQQCTSLEKSKGAGRAGSGRQSLVSTFQGERRGIEDGKGQSGSSLAVLCYIAPGNSHLCMNVWRRRERERLACCLLLWRGGLLLSEPEIKNALWHVHTGCPKPSICKLSTEAHEAWFMHALVA
eukprot:1156263-Pelagomonas_calceolata.AAC.3